MPRSPSPRKVEGKSTPLSSGLRWPLRAAAILGVLYLLCHLAMIPQALTLWGGLLSALLLGQ